MSRSQFAAQSWTSSPILTFIVILILPSCLTFITLLIHRIRMARAAQRDRAPENIVKSFPWRVWNGTAWEKHEGTTIHGAHSNGAHDSDLESGPSYHSTSSPSTSHEALIHAPIPWCETQAECAICLSEFVKGDRVRELPCHHIFHLEEVDSWLINRKKLVGYCVLISFVAWRFLLVRSVLFAKRMSPCPGIFPKQISHMLHLLMNRVPLLMQYLHPLLRLPLRS